MNPYEVLGLTSDSDFKDVIKAYRELAKKYHPDLAKSEQERQYFLIIFQDLTNAYNQIKNYADKKQNQQAQMLDADYINYLYSKTNDFLNKNEIENALNTLKIIEKSQKNARIFFLFAKAYKLKGYHKQAIDYFRKTLVFESYNIEALLGLAGCYESIGLKKTAIGIYNEVLRWQPDNKIALDSLNRLYVKENFLNKLFNNLRGSKDKKDKGNNT